MKLEIHKLEINKYQQARYIILFCKIHDVKNRPDRLTDIAVFNVTTLIAMNDMRQNIFYSCGNYFRDYFSIYIDERDRPPIFYARTIFTFFSIKVMTACLWELDISSFLKDSFTQLINGSQIRFQHFL